MREIFTKPYIYIFSILLAANSLCGQIMFNNPSFEGSCGVCGGAAPGWTVCASTPDVLPGCFGVNGAAQNGSTYAGFCTGENIGQKLPQTLYKNTPYSFTVYLRYDANYANGSSGSGCSSIGTGGLRGDPGALQIWGGTANCKTDELLFQTPTLSNTAWKQFVINFTPKNNNYDYIMLVQPNPGLGLGANIEVDNLSPILSVPITLISFESVVRNKNVEISWKTASEKENDHFILERSNDGDKFQPIAKIKASGTTKHIVNYSYVDESPATGITYYRLKQVDSRNSESVSAINSVMVQGSPVAIKYLKRNPLNNSEMMIGLGSVDEHSKLHIYDLLGKEVVPSQITADLDMPGFRIDTSNLNNGMYLIRLENDMGKSQVMKFQN